jgi:hypothetical protein
MLTSVLTVIVGEFDSISKEYDASVLNCNIENWAPLLGNLTAATRFVAITTEQARLLLKAYEEPHARSDSVIQAARARQAGLTAEFLPLNSQEGLLRETLGASIQTEIDGLTTDQPGQGCFVKLSSRSPKDAAARSGVFYALYRSAAMRYRGTLSDPNTKLRILCECESAALRFSNARDVIRALILSERVWQVRS